MNKPKKIVALLLGITALALTSLTAAEKPADKPEAKDAPAKTDAAPAAKPAPLFADPVIVKGKGFELKRSQLDEVATGLKATMAARGQNVTEGQAALLEKQLLERLIQIQLLLTKATDADKTKGKEMSEKRFATFKSRAPSEEVLVRQLKSMGMTVEQMQARLLDEATGEAVLERELKSKITVTDDQVKKYYDENPAQFEEPEMVRASHILLGTRDSITGGELSEEKKAAKKKEMEDILKRARAGEDFAKLAKEFSEDTGSKDKGGEYTFPRGQMVPEFEKVAFALGTNQISDIVTTQFGYHVIKLSEKKPARKVPLAEVTKEVKDGLTNQEVQKQLPEYFEKLKKEANVEILDEKLKANDNPPAAVEKPAEKPAPKPENK
ncbi:MAG: peptidylprolyl isomerase [Verrucomicrobia bacterium]|nr:peptidylprolyl isomerase [Verrucomicrobiota bacterium]